MKSTTYDSQTCLLLRCYIPYTGSIVQLNCMDLNQTLVTPKQAGFNGGFHVSKVKEKKLDGTNK